MNDDDAASLFASLLCDIMIPAELSEAIRLQGLKAAKVCADKCVYL